jgi:hypothetical protein
MTMKKSSVVTLFLLVSVLYIPLVQSAGLDGTWVYAKSVSFENPEEKIKMPASKIIQIVNQNLSLTDRCPLTFSKLDYYPGGPFQRLLKSDATEAQVAGFLSKNFAFSLSGVREYYSDKPGGGSCNDLGRSLLVDGDQLIAIGGGGYSFHSYVRQPAPVLKADGPAILAKSKLSQLPFRAQAYYLGCTPLLPNKHGIPQATDKCSPVYQPQVAIAQSKDPLAILIGSHLYSKGGARPTEADFNNPAAQGLHFVYLVFPPMKDVVVVRVDDLEGGGDTRDPMSGVFLSIKDGKVVDQLSNGCDLDLNYRCQDDENQEAYQMMDSGKFNLIK